MRSEFKNCFVSLFIPILFIFISVCGSSIAADAEGYLPAELAPTPGKTEIIINIPEFKLRYYVNGELALTTGIAVGKTVSPTQLGDYVIRNKAKFPTWYPPDGRPPVPPGPENPLGTRWMGLDRNGYGLHGTTHPGSIGRAASMGCIRMRTEIAEKLFDMVRIGTAVRLVYVRVLTSGPAGPDSAWVRLFTDIYNRDGQTLDNVPYGEISRRLQESGLGDMIGSADQDMLKELLRISRGDRIHIPFPLAVSLDGRQIPGGGITYRGERLLALQPIAGYLGVDLSFDAASDSTRLDGQIVKGIRVLAGRTFAPPAEVSRILGLKAAYANNGRTLEISSKDTDRPSPLNTYAVTVNGTGISTKAYRAQARLMLPLRAITDVLGLQPAMVPGVGISIAGKPQTVVAQYKVISGRAYLSADDLTTLLNADTTTITPDEPSRSVDITYVPPDEPVDPTVPSDGSPDTVIR